VADGVGTPAAKGGGRRGYPFRRGAARWGEERAGELWVGRRRVEEGATWLAVGPQPELAAAGPKDAGARRGCDEEGVARRGKGQRHLVRTS
jgi:hypothetical protein